MKLTLKDIKNWHKHEDACANWENGSIWNPYDGSLRALRTACKIGDAWLYVCKDSDERVDIILHNVGGMDIFKSMAISGPKPVNFSCFFDNSHVSLIGRKLEHSNSKAILECKCNKDNLMDYIKGYSDFWINMSMYTNIDDGKKVQFQNRILWNFDISDIPEFEKLVTNSPYDPYPLTDDKKLEEWNLHRTGIE